MDDIEEPGSTARDIPAGTVVSPAGTLIGVADTRGDPAPPNLTDAGAPGAAVDDALAGGPTSASDAPGEAPGARWEGANPTGDSGTDYRRLSESGADES